VLPEHLFYYRHLETGFSRVTPEYRNRQRVLRQFPRPETLPPAERITLWNALAGFQARITHLRALHQTLRYRVVDTLNGWLHRLPRVHSLARRVLRRMRRLWRAWRGLPPLTAESQPAHPPRPADDLALEPASAVAGLLQPPPESPLEYHTCVPGWFDYEDIFDTALRRARDGAVFVEVGAYLGRSTIYLASRLKRSGKKVRFYVVDLWDGWFYDDYSQQTPMRESGDVFWHFLRHLRAARVEDVVIPLKMSSHTAARLFDPGSVDFVFLDGDHSEKAVCEDLQAWYPLVRPGGMLGVHDYSNPDFPGVEAATDQFLEQQGLKGQPSRGVGVWFTKPQERRTARSEAADTVEATESRANSR
jgi:hypothetical protein